MQFLFASAAVCLTLTGCASLGSGENASPQDLRREEFSQALRSPQDISPEERQSLYEAGEVSSEGFGWSQWGEPLDADALTELARAWGSKEAPSLFDQSQRLRHDPAYYLVFEGLGLAIGAGGAYFGAQGLLGSMHSLGDIFDPILAVPLAAGSLGLGIGGGIFISRWIEGPARAERLEKARRLEDEGVAAMNAALYERLVTPAPMSPVAAQGVSSTTTTDEAVADLRPIYAVIGAGLGASLAYLVVTQTGGQTSLAISYGSAGLGGILGWMWGAWMKKAHPAALSTTAEATVPPKTSE